MIKILVNPYPVECETAQEAADLLRLLGRSVNGSQQKLFPLEPNHTPEPTITAETPKLLTFLRSVRDAGKEGITSTALRDLLQLSDARALGVMIGMLGRFLSEHKMEVKSVVIRRRTQEGERRWYRRSRLPEALSLLEGALLT